MCVNHHICATCPKGAPTIGQLGPRFRLPASGLSPWSRGDSWVGARWPTLSLVLPSVLGVPLSQCLLEVPSSCTPVPVLPRATSWSPALALPFHAETLVLSPAAPFSTLLGSLWGKSVERLQSPGPLRGAVFFLQACPPGFFPKDLAGVERTTWKSLAGLR